VQGDQSVLDAKIGAFGTTSSEIGQFLEEPEGDLFVMLVYGKKYFSTKGTIVVSQKPFFDALMMIHVRACFVGTPGNDIVDRKGFHANGTFMTGILLIVMVVVVVVVVPWQVVILIIDSSAIRKALLGEQGFGSTR
jgi:hypothetical protein